MPFEPFRIRAGFYTDTETKRFGVVVELVQGSETEQYHFDQKLFGTPDEANRHYISTVRPTILAMVKEARERGVRVKTLGATWDFR